MDMMLLDPKLSKIIEQIISNIILEEICTKNPGPLHTAWDFIANGSQLRALGFESLNECITSLSKAITTLSANKDKDDGGPHRLLLAEAYGLRALCNHEAEPTK
ncbi:Peptidase C50, separase [Artemisia annua]|uniref:Peptidase C50, separase n=1 Tax=Artemisia annua TaxID=35608 RepID=A0A2U1Q0D3_ARTAN|nr:Peptidase C50, separase [Artemisia annua]